MLSKGYDGRKRASLSIRLESAPSRWAFALIVLLIVAAFGWEAAHVWIAEEYADSAKPELWRRAAQWEPDNAAYWAQLGSMEAWDFVGEPAQAEADYERAVRANPYSERAWLGLANIYEKRGRTLQAQAAYETAQRSHAISPVVAWLYGNFLLRQGHGSEACSQFRKALLADPKLTEGAVAAWWNSGLYSSQPLGSLLPPQSDYYFEALAYFGRRNDLDNAIGVWNDLLNLHPHFRLAQALSFINDVISAGRVSEAQRLWPQALDLSRWPRDSQDESSLVFNGGFEHDIANGGFDWRELESAEVSFAFDTRIVHSGTRSLRVSFGGKSNVDFHHVFQYVVVEPRRRYRFEAYLKSSAISTDSGIRFLISDPLHTATWQTLTESVIGTQPWTRVVAEFVTGPGTKVVSIVLRREPSMKFDNKLGGTVWVDDVSLVALDDHAEEYRR